MPGQSLDEVSRLAAGGIVGFKISAFESSPTRFPRIDTALTLDLLEALAATDLPLGLHNEDQEIVRARVARAHAAGHNGIAVHSPSRPPAAELASTAQFLELAAALALMRTLCTSACRGAFTSSITMSAMGIGRRVNSASTIFGSIRSATGTSLARA